MKTLKTKKQRKNKNYTFTLERCSSINYREYNIIGDKEGYIGFIEQKRVDGKYELTSSFLDLDIKSYNLCYIKRKIQIAINKFRYIKSLM